ncbi:hypothetical protein QBC42DRAFT_45121 [Cladorrhinum samala]|uniref:Uncharacterized protein n=1 Tax=Cladorrhinum samala TaxID=585594 RepID=A0AAV9H8U0_9PEZI|nr:hypothetical protein QBC42DRAFT_45121 [Cladorrhinum samala]
MHDEAQLGTISTSTSSSSPTLNLRDTVPTATTIITVPVGDCCQSKTPPVNFGPSITLTTSTITTSSTASVITPEPSSSQSPDPTSKRSAVPPVVIAGAVIGAAAFVLLSTFLFFITCHRKGNSKKQKRRPIRMFSYPGEYQTVPANRPNSPPSHSPTPSSDSSLSTQGLLDLTNYANEQHQENEYTFAAPRQELSTGNGNLSCSESNNKSCSHMSANGNSDNIFHLSSSPRDRRSVDTIFALRFYYTHELDRRSKGSFLPELPATPVGSCIPPLPTSPPPPPPPPISSYTSPNAPRHQSSFFTPPPRRQPSKRMSPRRRGAYITPTGDPWKPGPPPAAPLPTVPKVSPAPSHRRRSTNPTFSLFPKPPSHGAATPSLTSAPSAARPGPLNLSKSINTSRLPNTKANNSNPPRSAPLSLDPVTDSARESRARGLGSAPLPSTPPKIVLQEEASNPATAAAAAAAPSAFRPSSSPEADTRTPKTPKSAPLLSSSTSLGSPPLGQQQQERFNGGLLTPPMGTGEFPPPPTTTSNERGRISMKGIEGGRMKGLPSPKRGWGWWGKGASAMVSGWRPRSSSGSSLGGSRGGTPTSVSG